MKSLVKISFFYTSATVISKLFMFLGIMWIIKTFSPTDYAYFALLFSMFQAISIFGGAGIKESIVGFYKDLDSEDEQSQIFNNAIVSSFPSILISVIAMLLFYFFNEESESNILLICFITSLFSGFVFSMTQLIAHMYRLKENHFLSIMYLFFPQIMLYIGGFIFVTLNDSPQHFFFGSALFVLLTTIILLLIFSRDRFYLSYGPFTKKIFSKSIPYFIIGITNWLKGYGNNFIILMLLGSLQVASYSFLFTLSGGLLIIVEAVNTVWVPKFYNLFYKTSSDIFEDLNNFIFGSLSVIIGIIVSVLIILYPFIVNLLGGNFENYVELNLELLIIMSAVIVYPVHWHLRIHYIIRSFGKKLMKINILSALLGISSMIMAIKIIGNLGIYIGFIMNPIFNIILMYFLYPKKWNIKINWLATIIGLSIPILTHYFYYVVGSLFYPLLIILSYIFTAAIYIFMNKNKVSDL